MTRTRLTPDLSEHAGTYPETGPYGVASYALDTYSPGNANFSLDNSRFHRSLWMKALINA